LIRRLAALVLLLAAQPVLAIVDVHEEYYANTDVAAFSTFEFNVEGAGGTKEETEFHLENHSMLRRGDSTWMFVGSLNFAETNDEESEDNEFAHLRYVRDIRGRHGVDVLAQYSSDEFELVERRVLWGGGYRYQWWRGTGEQAGLLGAGAIRERERYVDLPREQELWRANLYLHVETPVEVADNTRVSFSAYAQPAFEDAGDVRAIAILTVSTEIARGFAIDFSIDYSYDSEPATGIERSNWEYSSGLTYTFK